MQCLQVVSTLLKCGADPRAKRRNGKTASKTTKDKALRQQLEIAEEKYDEAAAVQLAEVCAFRLHEQILT